MEIKKKFSCDLFKTGYLDESGENNRNGSKYIILTYICTGENKKISKILKKGKEQLRRTKKGKRWLERNGGEIKFHNFPEEHVLIKILEELSKLDLVVRYIAVKKNRKDFNPSEKADVLVELIKSNVWNGENIPKKIIADKDYFNNKKIAYFLVRNYEEGIYEGDDGIKREQFKCDLSLIEKYDLDKIRDTSELIVSIKQENSKENINLQATDLISGAIFQELERGNKNYTNILRKNLNLIGIWRELK